MNVQNLDQVISEIAEGNGEVIARAARRFRPTRLDKPVTLSCLLRWIIDGVKGPDGNRVKLEAARVAGKWLTTPMAIERFIAAQNTQAESEPVATSRTPTRRDRASDRAGRQLAAMGI